MKRDEKLLFGIGAGGLLLIGVALLWGIIQAGAQIISSWVVTSLQVLVVGTAASAAYAVASKLVQEATAGLVERLAALERSHAELLRTLKRRSPAYLAAALLIGQVVLLLVDKSFDGAPLQTVVVSAVMIVAFWTANEFQNSDRRSLQVVGWLLWFATLLYFPLAVMLFKGWGPAELFGYLWRFDLPTRLFCAVGIVLLIAAPVLMVSAGETDL